MSDQYTTEAQRIIELLMTDFTLPNGALALKRQGGTLSPHHIFPDFGDVAPFFLYFGKQDFIDKQIAALKQTLHDGALLSEFPTWRIRGLAKSYEYSDFVLGLIDWAIATKRPEDLAFLYEQVEQMIALFGYDKTFRSYVKPGVFRLPIQDSRDGMMIELFCDLYALDANEKYITLAKNISNQLLTSNFYTTYHLFPTYAAPWYMQAVRPAFFQKAEIAKVNTNALYGLLALYRITHDESLVQHIRQTVLAIQAMAAVENGGVVKCFIPNQRTNQAFLTSSFMMLDFLCDAYHVLHDTLYLHFAQDIAAYWMKRQGPTGLFPVFHDQMKSFFDSETDMSIALYKLYELTNDSQYQRTADTCVAGILEHHGKYDYPLSVDVKTGEVIDATQKTKFLALFLKLLILKSEQQNGTTIYKNETLFNLLRDR